MVPVLPTGTIAAETAAKPLDAHSDRSVNVVRRWSLPGTPRGLAVDRDGLVYVGLSDRQSILRIDPSRDLLEKEIVLDRPEIASTKEIVTLRFDRSRAGERLLAANGIDESLTILSTPELAVLREITLEGEVVRDAVGDPLGRYLYILGRDVHIFDHQGAMKIRTIREPRPSAISVSRTGRLLAVAGSERISGIEVTTVALWDVETMKELERIPMQTDAKVVGLTFAAGDRALVAATETAVLQLALDRDKTEKALIAADDGLRTNIAAADLISTDTVCIDPSSSPQVISLGPTGSELLFPEKRCGRGGSMTGGPRYVSVQSLYPLEAFAIAWDPTREAVFATSGDQLVLYRYSPDED